MVTRDIPFPAQLCTGWVSWVSSPLALCPKISKFPNCEKLAKKTLKGIYMHMSTTYMWHTWTYLWCFTNIKHSWIKYWEWWKEEWTDINSNENCSAFYRTLRGKMQFGALYGLINGYKIWMLEVECTFHFYIKWTVIKTRFTSKIELHQMVGRARCRTYRHDEILRFMQYRDRYWEFGLSNARSKHTQQMVLHSLKDLLVPLRKSWYRMEFCWIQTLMFSIL